jgi:hypothetical protein
VEDDDRDIAVTAAYQQQQMIQWQHFQILHRRPSLALKNELFPCKTVINPTNWLLGDFLAL